MVSFFSIQVQDMAHRRVVSKMLEKGFPSFRVLHHRGEFTGDEDVILLDAPPLLPSDTRYSSDTICISIILPEQEDSKHVVSCPFKFKYQQFEFIPLTVAESLGLKSSPYLQPIKQLIEFIKKNHKT